MKTLTIAGILMICYENYKFKFESILDTIIPINYKKVYIQFKYIYIKVHTYFSM